MTNYFLKTSLRKLHLEISKSSPLNNYPPNRTHPATPIQDNFSETDPEASFFLRIKWKTHASLSEVTPKS